MGDRIRVMAASLGGLIQNAPVQQASTPRPVNCGLGYRGPLQLTRTGTCVPRGQCGEEGMDRQQREAELREMLTRPRGKVELLSLFKEHAGLGVERNLPPFGTLLVHSILK